MRVLLMFPGQGSQAVGMAAWLLDHPRAALLFERAEDVLGWDVLRVCLDGPSERLTRTDIAQPAIFVTSLATWIVLAEAIGVCVAGDTVARDTDFHPGPLLDDVVMVGHSLGDYSALVACGHLEFEDALRVVARRGRAMQACGEQRAGGMMAVLGMSDEQVAALCAQVVDVWPANYNCPGQVVVSGSMEGLGRFAELARGSGAGAKVVPLRVSGAFHSPLVAAATAEVAAALDETAIHAGAHGVFFSTTEVRPLVAELVREAMIAQLTSPVRFGPSVASLRPSVDLAVEVGPGKVLSGLVRRIDRSLSVCSTDSAHGLEAAARAWVGHGEVQE